MHDNPQYLSRKKEKQALCARTATPRVEWIPAAEPASVRLPAAA
jgi:hypothetical protein